ncbi:MAG: GTP-binding protein [Bacteroidota bacterium]
MNKSVTILTGFLGAGKTTFLNHLLEKNKDTRYAIIENEFGEQGIDNELVLRPDETIVELNNGCLCCTLNDNLYDILNELHERKDEFDEVIIEATGVADPTGLAEPFISHPLIKKHFPLNAIVCLIDAELVEDHLKETEEAINQISYSDVLLINKIDLVSEKYLSSLENTLRELNPLAKVLKGQIGQFPILEKNFNTNEKLENILHSHSHSHSHPTAHEHKADELNFPVHKPHAHHHHKHTKEIHSLTFTFDSPFDFNILHHQLMVYLIFQSQGLYRIKGLIWFENKEEQYILQSVGKRLDLQAKRAWNISDIKKSTIVFIGKSLPKEGLQKLLDRCLAKTKSTVN